MGASRLKPLTVKELEKLTATKPTTIKHRSLGGVPGFVLVHTPAGHTSYGLIYRASGERKKPTLGNTKMQTLGEARTLAGKYRARVEEGGDPHGDKIEERRQVEVQRHVVAEQQKLDVEVLWENTCNSSPASCAARAGRTGSFGATSSRPSGAVVSPRSGKAMPSRLLIPWSPRTSGGWLIRCARRVPPSFNG